LSGRKKGRVVANICTKLETLESSL
jgi:hypothetical protein